MDDCEQIIISNYERCTIYLGVYTQLLSWCLWQDLNHAGFKHIIFLPQPLKSWGYQVLGFRCVPPCSAQGASFQRYSTQPVWWCMPVIQYCDGSSRKPLWQTGWRRVGKTPSLPQENHFIAVCLCLCLFVHLFETERLVTWEKSCLK